MHVLKKTIKIFTQNPLYFSETFFSETDMILDTTVTKKLIVVCDYVTIIFWVYITFKCSKMYKNILNMFL